MCASIQRYYEYTLYIYTHSHRIQKSIESLTRKHVNVMAFIIVL